MAQGTLMEDEEGGCDFIFRKTTGLHLPLIFGSVDLRA
jgi:hypothetical protein